MPAILINPLTSASPLNVLPRKDVATPTSEVMGARTESRAPIILPNVRKLFIPDPGYTIFEADLKGADAQVDAAEAEDEDLKAAFRAGVDIHSHNAEAMWGSRFTQHPKGSHARDKMRQACKHAVHGTNKVGSAYAIARHPAINWTVHEADQFQKRWFSLHPGIRRFHQRTEQQLQKNRTVYNKLGFHRVYFDRIGECLPEAVAWIAQSTVALVTYLGWFKLEDARQIPAELLLQVHDSLVFQIPTSKIPPYSFIRDSLAVEVPYDDPLVIPWGLAASTKSWGDCQKID